MNTAYIGQLQTKEIIDGLYLGNLETSNNQEYLESQNITVILNLCETANKQFPNIEYHHIPVADEQTENIFKHFPEFYTIINEALSNNKKVLVHCFAGVSRSSTAVISYIMKSQMISLKDAYFAVRKKKRNISPNKGFWNQLCVYEMELLHVRQPSYSCVDYYTDYIYDFLDEMIEKEVVRKTVIEYNCDVTNALNALFK